MITFAKIDYKIRNNMERVTIHLTFRMNAALLLFLVPVALATSSGKIVGGANVDIANFQFQVM